MTHRFPLFRIGVILLCIAIPFTAFGDGRGKGVGSTIEWSAPPGAYESATLRVSMPDGEVITREYSYGRSITLRVSDLGTDVQDGAYNYEVTFNPKVSGDTKKKLENARAANDDAAARKALREAGLTATVYNGTFTVQNDSIVDTEAVEGNGSSSEESAFIKSDDGGLVTANPPAGGKIAVNDQVIPDDLIVQGSGCFGFDCVNNESFGFDTIRLKENNLRIKAEDTSVGTFPTNDWQLTFNDSASGGSSKFSVEDITGAKVPMTITAGASTNSIFVDSTGRVGFRTSTPVLDLHVATSNTPAIRLEQNNSGGFTAQTWDIGANEANFFIRDVTGGSKLSLRIRPGAPTSSLDISADGDIGVGKASPDVRLDVTTSASGAAVQRLQNTNAGGFSAIEYKDESGNIDLFFGIHNPSSTTRLNSLNGNNVVMMVNSTERLRVSTTGVTVTGDFSVTGVKNFAMPDPADPENKSLYYVALEGPEAGTYFRGTAKTVNGEVVIELPGYFSRITENERMTVQLTAVGAPGQLYVASKSPEKLVIKVAGENPADLEFDYLVQGIRKGYLDYQVERAGLK